jgi:hypothetical protein
MQPAMGLGLWVWVVRNKIVQIQKATQLTNTQIPHFRLFVILDLP